MLIRPEKENDRDAVYAVNVSAFETPSEANLVDTLREQAQPVVSLIAEDKGAVVSVIIGYLRYEKVGKKQRFNKTQNIRALSQIMV